MSYSILLMAVCVFTFGNKVSAQGTFFEFIPGWRSVYSEEWDNSYFISGLSSIDPFVVGDNYIQYTLLDFSGELIDDFGFSVNESDYINTHSGSQTHYSNDQMILFVASTGFIDGNTSTGNLWEYNKASQETELLHSYNGDLNSRVYTIAYKNDSSFIVSGQYSDNFGTSSLFLHETDLNGEPRWTYTTECGNNCYNYAEHILPLDNGNTVLLYREWDYEIGNQDKERAVLVMLDPEGIELWRAYPGNDADYKILPGGVLEQDGELLVCFTNPRYYQENGDWATNYEGSIHFERYQFNGELQDSFDLVGQIPNGFEPILPELGYDVTQIQVLPDGNILLSGHTFIKGFLTKITHEGELLWHHTYTPYPIQLDNPNFYEYTRILHTLPTSDGGFLCTGTYRSDPREEYPQGIQTAIALKVDEYGCLEEGCEITSVEELSSTLSSPIKVWPNPVTGNEFTLESQVDLHIASIVLVDVQGRRFSIEVESGKQLRSGTSSAISCDRKISSGLYTLLITTSEGVAYSLKLVFEE